VGRENTLYAHSDKNDSYLCRPCHHAHPGMQDLNPRRPRGGQHWQGSPKRSGPGQDVPSNQSNNLTRDPINLDRISAPLQRGSARAMSWIILSPSPHATPRQATSLPPTPHHIPNTWRHGRRRPAYRHLANRDSCIDGIEGPRPTNLDRLCTLQIYRCKRRKQSCFMELSTCRSPRSQDYCTSPGHLLDASCDSACRSR